MQSHRPAHIYLDNFYYFITISAYQKKKLFDTDEKKGIIYSALKNALRTSNFKLYGWVILPNHIHLLIKTCQGKFLPLFARKITGKSAIDLNKIDKQKGRKVWYQYWDKGIRNKEDFIKHLNYIHQNPAKHGYTAKMSFNKFSSYDYYLKTKGEEWLNDCFFQYPIIDFIADSDDNF